MANKNICDDQEQTVDPKYLPPFEIKLINKFDEDPRNILVRHKKKGKDRKVTLFHLHSKDNQKKKQKGSNPGKQRCQQEPWDEETFFLKPEDSLLIVLKEEEVGFKKIKKDMYIELPFIADYTLFFEIKDNKKRKKVSRPITYITRNTTPNSKIPTKEGKTVIRIPGDQRAWKLEIKSPRNMKEHCQLKNVLAKHLQPTNGESDDASVGDNGPG